MLSFEMRLRHSKAIAKNGGFKVREISQLDVTLGMLFCSRLLLRKGGTDCEIMKIYGTPVFAISSRRAERRTESAQFVELSTSFAPVAG